MLFFLVTAILASANTADSNPLNPQPRDPGGRVMGGHSVEIELIPYQVAIEYSGFHNCGGAIISAHYVLSAGHCFDDESQYNQTLVRAGSSISLKGGSLHELEKVFLHEKYRVKESGALVNDVAVLRVKQPFQFDETRQPVSLYKKTDNITAGDMAVISGWGYTEDEDEPSKLHAATVPIVDTKICHEAYSKLNGGLDAGQICAGYYDVGGTDTCPGDSGGPLVINGSIAGIVSWGYKCAEPKYPGVYTDVTYFRDWIDQHVQY